LLNIFRDDSDVDENHLSCNDNQCDEDLEVIEVFELLDSL
jgi:hypothetical protein